MTGFSAGPDPDSIEAVDHYPDGVQPMLMRITYSSNQLSDYVNLKRDDGTLCLELGPPLFSIVRKAGKITDLNSEMKDALAAIGIGGIVTHFSETVVEFARHYLPAGIIPETVGVGAAVYLIKKLWDHGKLMLGYIHHASIDELGNWMKMIQNAAEHPDLTVTNLDDGDSILTP